MAVRVCHLIDESLDYPLFRSIAKYRDLRFELIFGSTRPAGALQDAMRTIGVRSFALGAKSRLGAPRAIRQLVDVLRTEHVDVLHAHLFDPTWIGLLAARVARVPFVFTRHHSDHHIRMGRTFHTRVDSYCARRAAHVIAVSDATRRVLVEREGVPDSQISVVFNGVAVAEPLSVEGMARLRDELGIEASEKVVLLIGRLHEEKGHRFLFDALPKVLEAAGPCRVLLAGAGGLRGELEHDVERRGLKDRIRFLGRRDDIPLLIGISDVIVLPSLAESFGLSLVEAMALGKPVVATTTGGIPEVLDHGRAGLLVPPGDSVALAAALIRVLTEPELAKQLSSAGKVHARTFSEEAMVRGYEAVYDRVLREAVSAS